MAALLHESSGCQGVSQETSNKPDVRFDCRLDLMRERGAKTFN